LKQVWLLRRMVSMITSGSMESSEATEKVMERMKKTASNKAFLSTLTKDV
jgi:transcription termination factor Rho